MKIISVIVSTMVIVLISQHSTMGLPVNNTVVGESCSEGHELINGKCVPINSKLNVNEMESSSVPSQDIVVHEEQTVTKVNAPHKVGACLEGMKHNEHGMCEEVKLVDTTQVSVEATTDRMEKPRGDENLRRCPEGAQPDEQGACQEINPSNSKKSVIDPKNFLKPDGSCPGKYQKSNGACLFIKTKTNSTAGDNVSTDMRAKNHNEENANLESVPVSDENECPEGTAYSDKNLCRKRVGSLSSNPAVKPDGSCRDDYELINGKCLSKNSIINEESGSKTTIDKSKKASQISKPVNNEKLDEPTSEVKPATDEKPDIEVKSDATAAPL